MKKVTLATVATSLFLAIAIPTFAADIDTPDPNAQTAAFIGSSQYYANTVRGKSYALTSNTKMTSLNVQGTFYQSGSQKETGTGTTSSRNTEASWYTKDGVYSNKGSYTLNTASRTYFSGGKYAQNYASDSW
ncbi:hypothetical protein D3C77_412730 [compost metagenome]